MIHGACNEVYLYIAVVALNLVIVHMSEIKTGLNFFFVTCLFLPFYALETKFSGTHGDREISIFPCSADHEQDWQPYPVDPYSAICDDHTYIHTYIHTGTKLLSLGRTESTYRQALSGVPIFRSHSLELKV